MYMIQELDYTILYYIVQCHVRKVFLRSKGNSFFRIILSRPNSTDLQQIPFQILRIQTKKKEEETIDSKNRLKSAQFRANFRIVWIHRVQNERRTLSTLKGGCIGWRGGQVETGVTVSTAAAFININDAFPRCAARWTKRKIMPAVTSQRPIRARWPFRGPFSSSGCPPLNHRLHQITHDFGNTRFDSRLR